MWDRTGVIIAISTFIFSTILFVAQNGEIIGSLSAAILAAGLVWISYVILLWMYQAITRKE